MHDSLPRHKQPGNVSLTRLTDHSREGLAGTQEAALRGDICITGGPLVSTTAILLIVSPDPAFSKHFPHIHSATHTNLGEGRELLSPIPLHASERSSAQIESSLRRYELVVVSKLGTI